MCLDIHERTTCIYAQPHIYPTSSWADMHADSGNDEPLADEVGEALDVDRCSGVR